MQTQTQRETALELSLADKIRLVFDTYYGLYLLEHACGPLNTLSDEEAMSLVTTRQVLLKILTSFA